MIRKSTNISISIWIETEYSTDGDADDSGDVKLEGCFTPKSKDETEKDENQGLLLRLNYPA